MDRLTDLIKEQSSLIETDPLKRFAFTEEHFRNRFEIYRLYIIDSDYKQCKNSFWVAARAWILNE